MVSRSVSCNIDYNEDMNFNWFFFLHELHFFRSITLIQPIAKSAHFLGQNNIEEFRLTNIMSTEHVKTIMSK